MEGGKQREETDTDIIVRERWNGEARVSDERRGNVKEERQEEEKRSRSRKRRSRRKRKKRRRRRRLYSAS